MEGLICAWHGRNIWGRLKIKYRINYDCVVIILTEQDEEWNKTALKYLPDYMKRKSAKKALVFYTENCTLKYLEPYMTDNIQTFKMKELQVRRLLRYYCLYRFFDNVVFFSLEEPKDNNSREILSHEEITKEELICLGFYCLRCVPDGKAEGTVYV